MLIEAGGNVMRAASVAWRGPGRVRDPVGVLALSAASGDGGSRQCCAGTTRRPATRRAATATHVPAVERTAASTASPVMERGHGGDRR
jgi:hypothetical protein